MVVASGTQLAGYPAPQQTVPTVNAPGYPGPGSPTLSTIPTVDFSTALTPTPNTGVVVGKLVDEAGNPYLGTLYLGSTINADQTGFQPIVEFSEQNPRADVNPTTGQFVFTNVPPGTYGLIWWTPVGSDLIFMPDRKAMLLIDVSGGVVTDLGSVLLVSSR
ncbi:MAG: hypothetical protein ACT4QE_04895 [Anaerolineales bacterium]